MGADLPLRRKWTLRCGGRQIVVVKNALESAEHVLMKALIWALYMPQYPTLTIELPVGDRYKPDVVDLGPDGRPRFWGESGHVSPEKAHSLARRYPETHLVIAKWRPTSTRIDACWSRLCGKSVARQRSNGSPSRPIASIASSVTRAT